MARSTEELEEDKRNKDAYDKANAEAEKQAAREEMIENETDAEQRQRRYVEGVS